MEEVSLKTLAQTIKNIIKKEGSITIPDLVTNVCKQFDEEHRKTVRRRVYDSINVLCATGLVMKDEKCVKWCNVDKNKKQVRDSAFIQLQNNIREKRDILDHRLRILESQITLINKNMKDPQLGVKRYNIPFLFFVNNSPITCKTDKNDLHLFYNGTIGNFYSSTEILYKLYHKVGDREAVLSHFKHLLPYYRWCENFNIDDI